MERIQMAVLEKWKDSKDRKPLIVKGARQTGKSWLVEEFGRRYVENCIVFNFEEKPEYEQFLKSQRNVERILLNLSWLVDSNLVRRVNKSTAPCLHFSFCFFQRREIVHGVQGSIQ